MKRKNLILISVILAVMLMCGSFVPVFAVGTSAEAPAYDLWIYGNNLSLSDSVYIYYAVPVEGTNGKDVKMLFWLTPQSDYVYGTQEFVISPEPAIEKINDVDCYIFNFNKLAAKHMTVDVYARVLVEDETGYHYSDLDKYSVLQYCYNMLGKTTNVIPAAKTEKLLNALLEYGAAAQEFFETNLDKLANADYYQVTLNGATLADGYYTGLYAEGTELTVDVPMIDASGASFSHWEDSKGNTVETTAPNKLTVSNKNETYTPVYVKYSAGLEFESNEDGTCILIGMGDCTDTDLIIPPTALDGDKVTEIDRRAFEDEEITSVSFPNTIKEIGTKAFNNCTSLTDVYYDGTEEEWNEIDISTGNDAIHTATKHFKAPAVETFTVTFVDYDGSVLKTETVESGKSATAPADPVREGYTFAGWDKSFDNVTEDITVTAKYTIEATKPTILVESVTAKAGETSVEVTLMFLNNPGILGTKLTVSYDESIMTLKDAINGDALSSLTYTKPSRYKNNCNFMWFGSECGETADAVMLTLVFDISESAANGDYTIEVFSSLNDTYDTDYGQLAIDVINGCVTVK